MRVEDNPVLSGADCAVVVEITEDARTDLFRFPKMGAHRRHLRQRALDDLERRLTVPLVRFSGPVATSLIPWCREKGISSVRASFEPGTEEADDVHALRGAGLSVEVMECGALLPNYKLDDLPGLFTHFRKRVEPLSAGPDWPKPLREFHGEGQQRLREFIHETQAIRRYKQTRNLMIGENFSSKFSPFLACGALSPRQIWVEIESHERKFGENESTYWLKFELLWREFFRHTSRKNGAVLFRKTGLQDLEIQWKNDPKLLNAWIMGQTGYPIVDANMRELAQTGFMSNRGRQIVASFLTKNLGLDWRAGAEWFESQLVDYDVASNYGNWQYAAGVGNDAREFRLFNLTKQARDYDPNGDHARRWLPELADLPGFRIHQPNSRERRSRDYPLPIVDFDTSARENERIYRQAQGVGTFGPVNRHTVRK